MCQNWITNNCIPLNSVNYWHDLVAYAINLRVGSQRSASWTSNIILSIWQAGRRHGLLAADNTRRCAVTVHLSKLTRNSVQLTDQIDAMFARLVFMSVIFCQLPTFYHQKVGLESHRAIWRCFRVILWQILLGAGVINDVIRPRSTLCDRHTI